MDWLMWFIAYASTPIALLVVILAFLLAISGLLWLNSKLIIHILEHFNDQRIFASYLRNRKDFKQYLKDRKTWEEEVRKEKDRYWRAFNDLINKDEQK